MYKSEKTEFINKLKLIVYMNMQEKYEWKEKRMNLYRNP